MTPLVEWLGGSNAPRFEDTLAETGPGIPDDAVVADELVPGELGGEASLATMIASLVRSGWVSAGTDAAAESEQARAEAESEAHPT